MAGPVLLGIDLGTGSVKALLVSETGEILSRGSAEYPIHRPGPDRAEQDPIEWRRATIAAVREAMAAAGATNVAAIGLSGQMHGTVAIDREGEVVRPAIIWADARSAAEADEITEIVGKRRLIEIAGSPVAAGFQAATVRWLAKHEPKNWARTTTVLTPKDEIRRWLTGERLTEPSDASGALLFDVTAGNWSKSLMDAAEIQASQLPTVIPSSSISGMLLESVAGELGLPAGIPVAGGVADAPGAALGAGAIDPRTLLLTISTGAQALIPASRPLIDSLGRIHSFQGPMDSPRWYAMGATMAAGMSLRWLQDNVFELTGPDVYDRMLRAAESIPAGSGGLIFTPYLTGERTPYMDPFARGSFLGLTSAHRRGNLTRAVLEGVAFSLFDALSVLKELGAAPERIVLAGGGARSPLWRQIMADVFEMPVLPALEPDQSAVGAAMLAGHAAGWFAIADAARTWPRYADPVEPNASNAAVYRALLPVFQSSYALHKEDFKVLKRVEATETLGRES